jgi:VanZ family protein
MKITIKRWVPVIIWTGTIILLSSNSDPYSLLPERLFQWMYLTHIYGVRLTKIFGPIGHIFQYAILSFLLTRALVWKTNLESKHLILAFSISLMFAIIDEIHQYFVPIRACQLSDVILDALGSVLGLAVYVFIFSLRYYLEHRENSLS